MPVMRRLKETIKNVRPMSYSITRNVINLRVGLTHHFSVKNFICFFYITYFKLTGRCDSFNTFYCLKNPNSQNLKMFGSERPKHVNVSQKIKRVRKVKGTCSFDVKCFNFSYIGKYFYTHNKDLSDDLAHQTGEVRYSIVRRIGCT